MRKDQESTECNDQARCKEDTSTLISKCAWLEDSIACLTSTVISLKSAAYCNELN